MIISRLSPLIPSSSGLLDPSGSLPLPFVTSRPLEMPLWHPSPWRPPSASDISTSSPQPMRERPRGGERQSENLLCSLEGDVNCVILVIAHEPDECQRFSFNKHITLLHPQPPLLLLYLPLTINSFFLHGSRCFIKFSSECVWSLKNIYKNIECRQLRFFYFSAPNLKKMMLVVRQIAVSPPCFQCFQSHFNWDKTL